MTSKEKVHRLESGVSRRKFLRISAFAAAAAALPVQGIHAANLPGKRNFSKYHQKLILLTDCNIIDVKNAAVVRDSSLFIENGKIRSIVNSSIPAFSDIMIFNLKGAYVIPGLIDGHCHLTLTGVGSFKVSQAMANVRQMDRNMTNQIASGVTTVRDMGSIANILHSQIKKVDNGKLVGPRVIYCNRFLNVKGGHPSITLSDQGFWAVIGGLLMDNPSIHFEDVNQLKKEIGPNLGKGASFIKLTLDDKSLLCGKRGLPVYSDEMLAYIFDYAQKRAVPVAGHSQFRYGFSRMLDYPIGSLEHVTADEELSDHDIMRFAEKKTGIVPTMAVGSLMSYPEYERFVPEHLKENEFILNERKIRNDYLNSEAEELEEPVLHAQNNEYAKYYSKYSADELLERNIIVANPIIFYQMLYTGKRNINRLKDAGALIGCGTDAGVPYSYHGSLWYEIELMNRAGFSPAEVLKCATINNAKILNMDDEIGSIDEGKLADITVLEKNPLDQRNITAYRKPLLTFRDGELLYHRNQLKQENNYISLSISEES